jgi:hypothetical protein
VGNHRDCTVEQINPRTGTVTRVVHIGQPGGSDGELGNLASVTDSNAAVFALNAGDKYRTLVRVDLKSGALSSTKVGTALVPASSLVEDGGRLWLGAGPTVWELDSDTLATVGQVDLSDLATQATVLASSNGGLWVGTENERLVRLDEQMLKPSANVQLFHQGSMTAAVAGNSLWVAANGQHDVIRIDSHTGKQLSKVTLTEAYTSDSSFPAVAGANAHAFWLWRDASHLEERSATDGKVVKTLNLPSIPGAVDPADYYQGGVTSAFGSTWVTEWPGALAGFTSPVRGVLLRFAN